MKIRMEEGLLLIVTPESYVEHVALAKWAETHQGEGDLLIEAYAQQPRALDECPDCVGYGVVGVKCEPCKKCGGTGIRQ